MIKLRTKKKEKKRSFIPHEFQNSTKSDDVHTVQSTVTLEESELEETAKSASALHDAAASGSRETIRALVESGVDVNSYGTWSAYRCTALHWAVQADLLKTVRLLLDLGADASLPGTNDACSGTALDWAREMDRAEIQKVLEEEAVMLSLVAKIQLQKANAETVAKALEVNRIVELKAIKMAELAQDIAALKSSKDFRTDEAIEHLQADIEDARKLISTVQESLGSSRKPEDNSCPVCVTVPTQVFACLECDSWVCGGCKEQLVHCPSCRQDFLAKPPKRNKAVEKVLGVYTAESYARNSDVYP